MSFYDDLERNMQNPEFRRAYEEQTRQLESSPVEPTGKRLTWDQLRTHERQQGGYWDYLSGGKVWVSVPNPSAGATAEGAAPTPYVSGPVLRKRPIPDQLDYFSEKLAGLLDGAKLERDALIAIAAAVVNLGAIASQLRKQAAEAREEWGQKYSGGGYLTRPDTDWMNERWPIEQWAWDNTRNGGIVGKRRIVVVEDWREIRSGDLPKERPGVEDG